MLIWNLIRQGTGLFLQMSWGILFWYTSSHPWRVLWRHCIEGDCLVLLILFKWGQSKFWPEKGDVVHFEMSFPLIQKLWEWSEKKILIKVKSLSGAFSQCYGWWACWDESTVFCWSNVPWPNKYCPLQLCIEPSKRLKWQKINLTWIFPSLLKKLPIYKFCARLDY